MSKDRKAQTSVDSCAWCNAHPGRVCVSCTQRGRHATRLIEQAGMSVGEVAERMGLTVRRVERLLERERDRRQLLAYRCDTIPVAEIQRLIEARLRQEPTLSLAELARLAGQKSRINFERQLGLAPRAATTKRGKRYPARYNTTIDVHAAGVIVRALGLAPHEIPGL